MGLSHDELLDHGVASRCQGGDIGRIKPFEFPDPRQPHDGAMNFSHEQRLLGIVEMRVKQAPRAGRLVGGPKAVRPLTRMQRIDLSTQPADRNVVSSLGQSHL